MALKRAPLAHETTATTGTGSYALAGAVDLERATFNQDMNTSDTVHYMCRGDGSNWEAGLGTFTSPSTMARTTIIQSAIGGVIGTTAINWAEGVKDIYSLPDIEILGTTDFLRAANNLSDVADAGTSRTNLGLGSVAVEDASTFIRTTGGTQTIQNSPAGGNFLVINTGAVGTGIAAVDIGELTNSHRGRLRWDSADADRLSIFIHDGVSDTEVIEFGVSQILVRGGADFFLDHDPTGALQGATKQYVDAQVGGLGVGNLKYAAGDETVWGGAAVPAGFTIVTTAANDRIPLFVDTAAETKANAGSWTVSGLSITINNTAISVSQMPPHVHAGDAHTHDVTVRASGGGLSNDAGAVFAHQQFVAAGGDDIETYTSTSAGGGNTSSTGGGTGHGHTGSASQNGTWRPLHRTFCVITKS